MNFKNMRETQDLSADSYNQRLNNWMTANGQGTKKEKKHVQNFVRVDSNLATEAPGEVRKSETDLFLFKK